MRNKSYSYTAKNGKNFSSYHTKIKIYKFELGLSQKYMLYFTRSNAERIPGKQKKFPRTSEQWTS